MFGGGGWNATSLNELSQQDMPLFNVGRYHASAEGPCEQKHRKGEFSLF